jgi:hypothetical protein
VFAGDFFGTGFDQLAAYRRGTGGFEWLIHDDQFGPPIGPFTIGTNGAVGMPVAGDFNGNTENRDEVGVFTGTHWLLDTTGDFQLNASVATAMRGLPIVGDFDGDGHDDLGTYNPTSNTFSLSQSSKGGGISNAAITTTFRVTAGFPFIGVRERPVAADMDGDGIDDLGLWVPDRSSVTPTETAEWYFFMSGHKPLDSRIFQSSIYFYPTPFGNDIFARFGDEFSLPIAGNFDPPAFPTRSSAAPVNTSANSTDVEPVELPNEEDEEVLATSNSDSTLPEVEGEITENQASVTVTDVTAADDYPWHNTDRPADVNGDTFITARDALIVLAELNLQGARPLQSSGLDDTSQLFVDVNRDGMLSAVDALLVINRINDEAEAGAEGEFDHSVGAPSIGILEVGPSADDSTLVTDTGETANLLPPDQGAPVSPQAGLPRSESTYGPRLWEIPEDWTAENLDDVLDELAIEVASAWSQAT